MRTVILDAHTHTHSVDDGFCAFVVTGPKGEQIASGNGTIADSVAGFRGMVPEDQAGEQYTVTTTAPPIGMAPTERLSRPPPQNSDRIRPRRLRPWRRGDRRTGGIPCRGGPPAGAAVDIIATVDGAEAFRGNGKINENGYCEARFKLPGRIAVGDGTLAFVIRDGGVVEAAAKTIPILLQTVELKMYPEGGDLVAGLYNYVYLEARTPSQKPADIAGVGLDATDNPVATFRTAHEGRGRFGFVPLAGRQYHLRIDEPSGIDRKFAIPAVAARGVTLHASLGCPRLYSHSSSDVTVVRVRGASTNWRRDSRCNVFKARQ